MDNQLPMGAYERYMRDVYAISRSKIPFDQFCEQSKRQDDERIRRLNASNPVVYDHEFRLGCVREYARQPRYIIHVFTRRGMPISYHEVDPMPNGGEGYVSREAALERVREFGTKEDVEEMERIPLE